MRLTLYSSCLLASTLVMSAAAVAVAKENPAGQPIASEGTSREVGSKSYYSTSDFDLSGISHYAPKEQVSGTIRIWGSNAIADGKLAALWEAGFRSFHPNIKFEHNLPNSIIEMTGLAAGVADIGVGPRETYNDIGAFSNTHGYDPTEIRFATGSFDVPFWNPAFAIFVNRANPLSHLTMEQLDGIFGAARSGGWDGRTWHPEYARGPEKNLRTWGDVGLKGEWANKPIHVIGLNMRAHWATSISDFLLKGSDKWNENLKIYPGAIRYADKSHISGAESMVLDVEHDPYAICYSTIFFEKPQTKALDIATDAGSPYEKLTLKSVQSRKYPLTDSVYMYIDRKPGKAVDPKVREFLSYILSQEGQHDIAEDGKYLPLLAQDAAVETAKINAN